MKPAAAGCLVLIVCMSSRVAVGDDGPGDWLKQGRAAVNRAKKLEPITSKARNVILFIGDGMGIPTVTAARILEGQLRGETGEENVLSFETLPYTALIKTYNTNQQTPDSAGTITAIITGAKTKAGLLSVDETVTRGDAVAANGHKLTTILELAERAGRSTGVVSTTRVTHATPAGCYAHSPERGWEHDGSLPPAAKAAGFPDIARQLVEFAIGDGLEVALGGGRRNFLPSSTADPEHDGVTGSRGDGRDLTAEWRSKPRARYVWNKTQFDALDLSKTDHLLGLFEPSHMQFEHDRKKDPAGEPSLSEMTATAIDLLAKNPKGFFLMVEGGRIDHAHHGCNAFRALTDTIEFAAAVRVAMARTDRKDTLIVVAVDHSSGVAMGGYATRGNPILGKVVENDTQGKPMPGYAGDINGKPFTTIAYATGSGPRSTSGRADLTDIDTENPAYRQEAAVPLDSGTHGGEDVPLYADGPGAWMFHGVLEQNVIFHLMVEAMGLETRAPN